VTNQQFEDNHVASGAKVAAANIVLGLPRVGPPRWIAQPGRQAENVQPKPRRRPPQRGWKQARGSLKPDSNDLMHAGSARAGCGKVDTGFPHNSRSKYLESITFYDFGLIQSKIIVI
jgi:hypothetical protein